ncbi:MAG TPA: isoprenylcysteine carboxylmethyltransferase family protein, partial [Candidatus Binataceae bacterium]|nr:isoprenylcysteine carboxylmethyltransferase family protein [Candidatus Binataceae bacterium]
AALFFSSLLRGAFANQNTFSEFIWIAGATMMGLFALVRATPKAEMVTLATLSATGGMMLFPLLRPVTSSPGWLHRGGETIELAGLILTQLSRLYLGRSFGLLPANRGVVSGGPFRLVRHPVYLGWLILTVGFTTANPISSNLLVTLIILPFMFARIEQEEIVLETDPQYRAYRRRTCYRLLPGLF